MGTAVEIIRERIGFDVAAHAVEAGEVDFLGLVEVGEKVAAELPELRPL